MTEITRITIITFLFFISSKSVWSQEISISDIRKQASGRFLPLIEETYRTLKFRPAWEDEALRKELAKAISEAEMYGLDSRDYKLGIYEKPATGINRITDIKYTEAAIHLAYDIACGNKAPLLEYRGLRYEPEFMGLPILLASYIERSNLSEFILRIQPAAPEYRKALEKLHHLQRTAKQSGFTDIKVTSIRGDLSNKALVQRLRQLGFINQEESLLDDSSFKKILVTAQKEYDLLQDGKVRNTLLGALNVSINQRIEELYLLLNIIRWTSGLREKGPSVILNIPSANLMVYDQNQRILYSRVITGKSATPTPTLSSVIEEIILYPYWVVPYKIATRELLPRIKRDVSYMERHQFQVIDNSGRPLNPRSVRWKSFSASYFPYTIRQSTGCDNSLGLIKFNFENPFSVYLHDTPGKELFKMSKRFFSHGCMRVEKPAELARLLLDSNRQAIDTLTEKGCLYNQKPLPVKVEKKASLAVLYSTAWYSEEGEIIFYEDIYKKWKK